MTLTAATPQGEVVLSNEVETQIRAHWAATDAAAPRLAILKQIANLELQQTPRRIRDAIKGVDNGWLVNLETQISALRAQLGS